MKVLPLGLQNNLVTSYDQTKTTLQGRASQRTINDGNGPKLVIGPSPVVVSDVFDDTGAAPVGLHCSTPNGRIFIGKGFAAGVLTISCYTLNYLTGAETWIGDLKFTFTNTGTYTLRGFCVDDTTPSAMKFVWSATNTTVQQGGLYASFGVDIADFHTVSVLTYPIATLGSTNKTVYQIGDQATQAAHTITVPDGCDLDSATGFIYILNGLAATPKVFKLVGTVPTTAPVAGYSIANGAIVVTGTLPALSGTVLLTNNLRIGTIGHGPNAGSAVLTFLTSTTIYNAKTSDVTNGAASLPSLAAANMALSPDFITITAALGQYFQAIDQFVIVGTAANTIVKQAVNNDTNGRILSSANQIKTEIGGTITPTELGGPTNLCCTEMNGWAVITSTTIGARGFTAFDLFNDDRSTTSGEINTSIISPVISGNFTQGILMSLLYELAKRSVKPIVQFRVSGFATGPGPGFDALWTTAPKDGDLSLLVNATQAQFRLIFDSDNIGATNPPQLVECYFIYNDATQISENWAGSEDNSTQSGASPMYVAFRLRAAYATSVPKLFVRGVDDSGNVIFLFDTVTNISAFSYTTNNGTSWTPLGTVPNVALTTELRVQVASPSGTRLTWAISES